MSNLRLVDIDLNARVIATEVPIDADIDLEEFRNGLRDAMTAWVTRGFGTEIPTPIITVGARVVEV